MEDLFTTNLVVNNQDVMYRVVFENDRYSFISKENTNAFKMFSFKREADEWHNQELLPTEIKNKAIEALENYLLQQH